MEYYGFKFKGKEVRVIIKFPNGLAYVGEIINHNGDYGFVIFDDKIDNTKLVYFKHNDIWWIENEDLEEVV